MGEVSGEAAESRRGLVEGLESPHPIAPTLPSVFQDDELTLRSWRPSTTRSRPCS